MCLTRGSSLRPPLLPQIPDVLNSGPPSSPRRHHRIERKVGSLRPNHPTCVTKNRDLRETGVAMLGGGVCNNKQFSGNKKRKGKMGWEVFSFWKGTPGLANALLRVQSRVKKSMCCTAARLSRGDADFQTTLFVLAETPRLSIGLIIEHVCTD